MDGIQYPSETMMDHTLFNQFCQLEQWHHKPMVTPDSTIQSDFLVWQKWLLRKPIDEQTLACFPTEAIALYHAWQFYHKGQYKNAFEQFLAVLDSEQKNTLVSLSIDAALGICRIYTRIGHWHHARLWGVYALQQCRVANRLFDISRCFNALGDLLCRAGHLQLAHIYLTSSSNVLPQGSVHKARHLNNVAITLMRQQATVRAEAILMNSLYLAKDTQDHASLWHALARLQWLYIDMAPDIKVIERFATILPGKETPIALAYIDVALAILALRVKDENLAKFALVSAAQRTSNSLPIESAWFTRSMGAAVPTSLQVLLDLPCVYPIDLRKNSPIDHNVLQAELLDHQFSWLNNASLPLTEHRLLAERQYFFI